MDKGVEDVGFYWVKETKGQLSVPMKMKRKVRPKKMEFVGWGSKPLIDFLQSIGKDTSKQLSRYDVTAIVNNYVKLNKLIHPEKKKRILCDERLYFLFGKKSLIRIKIYDLLESHFAENQDESEDDFLYSSEEKEENVYKEQKMSTSDRKILPHKKKVLETPKSCFAAIVSDNIKLVYLKRSLVQELAKHCETFEGKLMGSFVRIKSDPNDYSQKNSHQLLQVIGVRNTSGVVTGTEILLQASSLVNDIRISMLSDDNFTEEECEDLRQRVKAGFLKTPLVAKKTPLRHKRRILESFVTRSAWINVSDADACLSAELLEFMNLRTQRHDNKSILFRVEFEEKAKMLHEDITKHWVVREIALLQNLIDRANEKGWRKELFEYMERKQLLQTPSEQSRLLSEAPKVIAEELEPEAPQQDASESEKQKPNDSPQSILKGVSENDVHDLEASRATENGATKAPEEDQPADFVREQFAPVVLTRNGSSREMQIEYPGNKSAPQKPNEKTTETRVIELSDDDDDNEKVEAQEGQNGHFRDEHCPESPIWYYLDPQGDIQGPFSMASLKRWSDADYFHPDFKVWRSGQSPDEAVLLREAIHPCFATNKAGIPFF